MTQLLANLTKEIGALDESGSTNLDGLLHESDEILDSLRDLESQLATSDVPKLDSRLEKASKTWYNNSIQSVKNYNSLVNKFSKNIVHSHKYTINLDNAYPFPLALNPYPVKETPATDPNTAVTAENRQNIMKSIILHLLKIGQGSMVQLLFDEIGPDASAMDPLMFQQFLDLRVIVQNIRVDHDLTLALQWFEAHPWNPNSHYTHDISFRFHVLQFVLLLCGNKTPNEDSSLPYSAFEAYNYAKTHFSRYIKDFVEEISPIMTLLLFRPTTGGLEEDLQLRFKETFLKAYTCGNCSKKRHAKEVQFVQEILTSFDNIHENHMLFENLANEFVAEFSASLLLSSELSLFQSLLAGFVNIPNFYKYNNLQRRLSRGSRPSFGALDEEKPVSFAPSTQDLPFQLPDTNRFLFRYHPIFICPVSKEQLVPLSSVTKITEEDIVENKKDYMPISATQKLLPMSNPVVVFNHCRHVALKDSVKNLSKGGSEVFKCHYCYKKHKLSDVSEAYFIDL